MSDMKFWRPGKSGPEETVMLDSGSGDKITTFNPNGNMSLNQQRQKLPIFQYRNHILWLIENYKTVVLVGETGCGKSTQIPQYLHEAGWTGRGHQVQVRNLLFVLFELTNHKTILFNVIFKLVL